MQDFVAQTGIGGLWVVGQCVGGQDVGCRGIGSHFVCG